MRDPNRIERCTSILTKVWLKNPDIRFHQMIENLKFEFYKDTNKGNKRMLYEQDTFSRGILPHTEIDLYNVEDDEFFRWLEKKYEDVQK